jgi:hypothetical protein
MPYLKLDITVTLMTINEYQKFQNDERHYVQQRLNQQAEKMIWNTARKGKQGHEFKIGDKVLILWDLNNTKKSIKDRKKLEKPYLDIPATIIDIPHTLHFASSIIISRNGKSPIEPANIEASSGLKCRRTCFRSPPRQSLQACITDASLLHPPTCVAI